LTVDANGDLFGTTQSGGAGGYGTVFEIQNTGTLTTPTYAALSTLTRSSGYTSRRDIRQDLHYEGRHQSIILERKAWPTGEVKPFSATCGKGYNNADEAAPLHCCIIRTAAALDRTGDDIADREGQLAEAPGCES
jgi:uncharacterized repeat protein (TIGR03803 family)